MSNSFHLGLTMAGAVSAGAYTGGVLDYLLQTLDAWHAQNDRDDVPKHSISIDIISGASAGGITGAMTALSLFLENRNPVIPSKRDDEQYLKGNVFYNAWVNLTQEDMLPELLNLSDYEKNTKIVSLLNSEFIERLAKQTIRCVPVCATSPPSYISRQMELILTLSNLDGFTYELSFSAEGSSKHVMKQHRDYAFFRLGSDYGADGRIPLNLQREDVGLAELVQSAPATGAFPIGLAYRKFVRKKKYILDNEDLVFYRKGVTRMAGISEDDPEGEYVTYNVDGGMLNNEPFDLTMKLMAKASPDIEIASKGELEKAEKEFTSSIIMIDPFPSDDSIVAGTVLSGSSTIRNIRGKQLFPDFPYTLLEAMSKVFASMRGELLFKGEDIVKAFSQEDFSRFLIAPRRREQTSTGEHIYNGSVAIACGALGGFSGFFDKSFRRHDFFLGRANCQSFLRKYFRVQLENGVPINPLFREGYTKAAIERFKFQDPQEQELLKNKGEDPSEAIWYVPIIPDVFKGDVEYDELTVPYPKFKIESIDHHKKALLTRFKVVSKSMSQKSWFGFVINVAFFIWGNKIYKKLRGTIEREFRAWKLM